MSGKQNYSEYTRLRDIAHKRAVRLEKAGMSSGIRIPTVADIKAGRVSAGEAMQAVKNFLSGGSTVTAVRQTGLVPEFRQFNLPPEKPKAKETSEEKKAKKRQRDREYRQRKAVREGSKSSEQAKKRESYLKALKTAVNRWKSAGFDLGIDLSKLTPKQASAFTEYMEYRFSQGDFTQHYVINDFVQDFAKLLQKGHKAEDIVKDFDRFLADRGRLEHNAENMEGLSAYENQSLWDQFIGWSDDDSFDDLEF